MALTGSEPYDKEDFFATYIQKRNRGNSPNDNLEKPVFDDLVGEVTGKRILDLGCGDGKYGKELLMKGASFYHGIDNSSNMISLAKQALEHEHTSLEKRSIEEFELGSTEPFDMIVSRLALHYIKDLTHLATRLHSFLRSSGRLIFSVEHPVITSCYEDYNKGLKRGSWLVDNYFRSGERTNLWMGEEVIKYHRSLEEYISIFQQTGFSFQELKESNPREELFEDKELLERRRRIPLFLFLSWSKK